MTSVGFIGLGSMGLPMAKNLVAKGFAVRGYDVRPEPGKLLAKAGGTAAGSSAEAAKGADVLILMVVSAAQAQAVLFDEGALDALPEKAAVILMATCAPRAVEEMAARVTGSGREFIDAPVSGGAKGAETATLTIMAAAPGPVMDRARGLLEALGDKLFHVGERPGQGATVKTVNQLLCGVHIAAAAEAFALAAKVGVDTRILLEILGGSAASSWMLRDRGPRMLESEPAVSSSVDIFVKDLGLVLEAGRDAGTALPLAAVAHQLFVSTSGRGDGAADDSQVIRAYTLLNSA